MKIVDYRQVVKSETQLQDVCPYVGLEAFDRETAKYFKGRNRFIRLLLQKLDESNFGPVIGASGSGKSSLVRAGLIPALEEQGDGKFCRRLNRGIHRSIRKMRLVGF